ncbi:carbohydrate ABC transporter permease [Diplocloster agilis]|uniref:Sugar ABC transporter permease n=1 Tax=Diplocloster agilis TaxID=2850323 RepID=A0A949JYC5_9FIRM|nr:sugar ABC transporter permease [Diplocloster agilis]MBU9737465.1 sugar ABC transporter permease [Diplocloster agilis]
MNRKHSKTKAAGAGKPPLLWLVPLAVVLLLIFIYPLLDVIRLSFTNTKIGSLDYNYTIASYKSILTDRNFYYMLRTTVIFVFFSVVFQTLLGLAIAVSVDKGEKLGLRGTVCVRTISLISMVIPGVVIGIIWKMMFDESNSGLLNYMIQKLGFGPVPFLTSPNVALVSATVANVWRGTAQSMILLYCGIKTVSADILEAAMVDGASAWKRLIHITLPSMRNVLAVNIILNLIGTFNTFDMVMSLTGGGPGRSTEVLALSVYNQIFGQLNMGKGSAVAVILIVLNMIMAFIYFRIQQRGEVQ